MDTKKILTELYAERKRVDAAIAALEALSTSATSRTTKTPAKTSSKPSAKKRVLSPEGRKRIAEAAKKRWAAVKRTKTVATPANKPAKKA